MNDDSSQHVPEVGFSRGDEDHGLSQQQQSVSRQDPSTRPGQPLSSILDTHELMILYQLHRVVVRRSRSANHLAGQAQAKRRLIRSAACLATGMLIKRVLRADPRRR